MTDASAVAAGEDRPERLSGAVAVLIAFATLVGALTGFLQADASNQADDRRDDAVERSLQALASSHAAQTKAQVELDALARWVQLRAQAGNAVVAAYWADADPVRRGELALEAVRWATMATATLEGLAIDPESEFGPDEDPAFPTRYLAAASLDSLFLNGLQDAANEEASRLDQRAAAYTAVLAMIAVALYLFGLTLAVSGRSVRVGFLGVGVVMLGVAALWTAQTMVAAAYDTSDEAAAEFARGVVAHTTASEQADYQAAEAHFSRAIELRPTYAYAYAARSDAIVSGASPQRSTTFSIAPPEVLARAGKDLETAVSLGLESTISVAAQGAYALIEGVQSADLGLLQEGIEHTRRAIALDPTEPTFRYSLAAGLLAAGRIDEARGTYQEAVAVTIYRDGNPATPRNEPRLEEYYLASALTDLEFVRAHVTDLERLTGRSGLEANILALKEQLVGRITFQSFNVPPASATAFTNVTPRVFLAEVQLEATVQNLDATRDRISAQWYHNTPEGHGWAVIPEVSQLFVPTIGAEGSMLHLVPYLYEVDPPSCLPDGSYRVEIYVNGRLVSEATATASYGDYSAFVARDLSMAMCRPAGWERRDDRFPGLRDGFQSADGLYGAYGVRFSLPGSVLNAVDATEQVQDAAMTEFADWFPAAPTYDEVRGTTHEYFLGIERVAWRWYDYGSGQVWVAGGVSPEGDVLIGMVHGPYSWFETSQPQDIMNSLVHVP